MSGGASDFVTELESLQQQLEEHFGALHAARTAGEVSLPLFALEHGLSEIDRRLLRAHVCAAIKHGHLGEATPLPLMVYATEIGYAYAGTEYWQTFEGATPGWREHGNRRYIRDQFEAFGKQFGGATPTGAWARHFSIIAWPITHAVLPTDLQRQLARLLFEQRHALTSSLLADPQALGTHLAARSLHASERFQNFAQNTRLLGQVAAALLSQDEEPSPYLLQSTLKRITDDLSRERDARSWLRGAKSTASSVRVRGFRGPAREPAAGRSSERGREGVSITDPAVWLQRQGAAWAAYVELPDLSPLVERLPELGEELRVRRTLSPGLPGQPLARGRVLYPGQRLLLSDWPENEAPFLVLENGSPAANTLLADQCILPPGSQWLFSVREASRAPQVLGQIVRPGRRYVLVSKEPLDEPDESWIRPTDVQLEGAEACELELPVVLAGGDVELLNSLGLGVAADVTIRPAALVPAAWDEEGRAAWLTGEEPVLAISSNRSVARCIVSFQGEDTVLEWPQGEEQLFTHLTNLTAGAHSLQVALISSESDAIAEGSFEVLMRNPVPGTSAGSFREGLMMLSTPVGATLTELWDGVAQIEIRGPSTSVDLRVGLEDGKRSTLAMEHAETTLPLAADGWHRFFERHARRSPSMQGAYDQSEACVVSLAHSRLGELSIRAEREFAPLRWIAGHTREGPFLRLVNNTDATVALELCEFSTPDRPRPLSLDTANEVRSSAGGLVTAAAGSSTAAMVLPPRVRDLRDMDIRPRLAGLAKSKNDLIALIQLASRWASASRPANPVAESGRIKVLRAITATLCSSIGGKKWAAIERRAADLTGASGLHLDRQRLQEAVGQQAHQKALAADVTRWIDRLAVGPVSDRVASFAAALALHARKPEYRIEDIAFAEFLLRLASEPGSLGSESEDALRANIDRVWAAPMLLKAARYLVLAIDEINTTDSASTFGGWPWQ